MELSETESSFEDFLIVLDLYDGPMRGIVFYHGLAHVFERYEDETEGHFIDKYRLAPLQSEFCELAQEAYNLSLKIRVEGRTLSKEKDCRLRFLQDWLYTISIDRDKCFDSHFRLHWPSTWKGDVITDQWKVEWLTCAILENDLHEQQP